MPPYPDAARWFDQEVRPFEPALKSYLRAAFPSLTDVEDVVQESYIRVLGAWRRGDVREVRPFLFAVARNAALDDWRRRQVVRFEPLPEPPHAALRDEAPAASEVAARRQELELLADAVSRLPDRCRQVMNLRLVYQLPVKEIAERLGMSALTVKTHLARGMRQVTARLEEKGLPA